jgi:cytochrome c peroxidase
VAICSAIIFFAAFTSQSDQEYNQLFKTYFAARNNELVDHVLKLFTVVQKENFNADSAKKYLSAARVDYKSIEPFVRYFMPGDARILNSPIIAEMEEDDEISAYVVPHGFQYLEKLLYGDSLKFQRRKVKDEVDEIYTIIGRFNESISYMDFKERDIFEAIQLHLVRQFVLGFADFETSESRTGVQESAATLAGYKNCLSAIYPKRNERNSQSFDELIKSLDDAIEALNEVPPMKRPDYLDFYSDHYVTVSGAIGKLRDLTVSDNTYNTTAINFQVRSIFDPHAFNTFFFLPAKQLASRDKVIELGRTLFFDPALSANNLRACASCHQPGKAFTDGLPLSQSFEPGKMLTRNAPTVINSVLQRKLFHDGRAFTFEDQAGQVMSNPLEMHNDFSQVALKLRDSKEYIEWFRSAFAGTEDTIITNRSVLTALAEYERSLVGMNSRFDKTVSGRSKEMNPDEHDGFNLFMGKGKCGSCHFIPLFNGVMPPDYTETEWEILGVPSVSGTGKRTLDPDMGRSAVINVDIFRHAFKTPTLRNVELTGPYMHNGVFRTLEEVIEFYDAGGGTGLGYDVPFQTLDADSLHLTSTEKFQLVAFLKTLTDTVNLTARPTRLPLFMNNTSLNSRPIGGEY